MTAIEQKAADVRGGSAPIAPLVRRPPMLKLPGGHLVHRPRAPPNRLFRGPDREPLDDVGDGPQRIARWQRADGVAGRAGPEHREPTGRYGTLVDDAIPRADRLARRRRMRTRGAAAVGDERYSDTPARV